MQDKINTLKSEIKVVENTMKEVKASGNDERAFQLFKKAQSMRAELSLMNRYKKVSVD